MPSEWLAPAAGLAGVVIGQFGSALKDSYFSKQKANKEAYYLSIVVANELNEYVNRCLLVARDDGTDEGRPAGENDCNEITVTAPTFSPLTLGVDWKCLPTNLMLEILRIPSLDAKVKNKLSDPYGYDEPPDYREFFWDRRQWYGELGLEVAQIAKRLRKHSKLKDEVAELEAEARENELRGVVQQMVDARKLFEVKGEARRQLRLKLEAERGTGPGAEWPSN